MPSVSRSRSEALPRQVGGTATLRTGVGARIELLSMKLPIPAAYLKLGAAAAIVGAVAAGAISFTLPRRYVSTAVMRFTPQAVPAGTAWQIEHMARRNLEQNLQDVLSRSSLTEMIQRIGLDLYREDPWEYGIEDMRSRD